MQKLAKQIANLSSKLSSDLKTLKTKALSTEDSIKHILQQLREIKNQVCISEESLISQLQETSHQEPALQQSTVIADSNEYTYAAATSNRYESLVEENRSIVESTPCHQTRNLIQHLLLRLVPLLRERNHQSPSPTINLRLHPPQIRIICTTQTSDHQRDRCCCWGIQ